MGHIPSDYDGVLKHSIIGSTLVQWARHAHGDKKDQLFFRSTFKCVQPHEMYDRIEPRLVISNNVAF